jgi:hypothetical protein
LLLTNECTKSRFFEFVTVLPVLIDSLPKCCRGKLGLAVVMLVKANTLVSREDGLHIPWAQSTCQLLLLLLSFDGELYVDGICICCAKEFLIPKELPILLIMTRVQNNVAKKQ